MPAHRTIRVEAADGVATLTLNRPEVRNAIDLEMVRELTVALHELAADASLRVVILRGEGGTFAGGADIGELRERRSPEALRAINATLFQQLEDLPLPTIAVIRGFALGGGAELALACDLRIAAATAKLGFPEVSLGIFPAAGGTHRLPRLVGLGRAKELVFTGRILGAQEALELGLVERVVPEAELDDAALALAKEIAANAPLAVRIAKLSFNAVASGSDPAPLEQLGQALLFDSQDKLDRMAAFLARKRRKEK